MKNIIKSIKTFILLCAIDMLSPATSQAAGFQFNVTNHIKFSTVEEVIVALLNIFIIVATPIIVLFIIYAGFLYVTAGGNTQQVQKATTALTYAIIGGIMVLGAVVISGIIADIVSAFKSP